MDRVKFGIIGAGGAWGFHSVGCKGSPVIEFTSVFDVNEKVAKRAAKRPDGTLMAVYTKIEDLLQGDLDALLIMVPHFLHEQYVIAAAQAKKHVLCEKPMSTTLEGCQRMMKATKQAKVKFMIAENHRFLPAHQYIHDTVQKGIIGDVVLVRAFEGVNEIPGLTREGFWKGDPILAGGGALMDMGAHKFAALNWILDDTPAIINAWLTKQCTHLPSKAEDNALVMARYSKGPMAEIAVSFTESSPPNNTLEIHGTQGTILENHAWDHPIKIYSTHESMNDKRHTWIEPDVEHGPFPIYYNISSRIEDEYFARCILEDRPVEFTPEQAMEAIFGVLMGYLSAEKGKPVNRAMLKKIAKETGTRSILEGLLPAIFEQAAPRKNDEMV